MRDHVLEHHGADGARVECKKHNNKEPLEQRLRVQRKKREADDHADEHTEENVQQKREIERQQRQREKIVDEEPKDGERDARGNQRPRHGSILRALNVDLDGGGLGAVDIERLDQTLPEGFGDREHGAHGWDHEPEHRREDDTVAREQRRDLDSSGALEHAREQPEEDLREHHSYRVRRGRVGKGLEQQQREHAELCHAQHPHDAHVKGPRLDAHDQERVEQKHREPREDENDDVQNQPQEEGKKPSPAQRLHNRLVDVELVEPDLVHRLGAKRHHSPLYVVVVGVPVRLHPRRWHVQRDRVGKVAQQPRAPQWRVRERRLGIKRISQ
eukprot:Amastigsp_a512055_22.p2 type:complete len:328 gc:universal Amastigsp_a512055_22:1985-1002(-)